MAEIPIEYPSPPEIEPLQPATVAQIRRNIGHLALIEGQPLTLRRSPLDQNIDVPISGDTIVGTVSEFSHGDGGVSRFMWYNLQADRATAAAEGDTTHSGFLRGQVDFQRQTDDAILYGSIQYFDLGKGRASVEVKASANAQHTQPDEGFAMNSFAIVFGMQRIWQMAYEKRGKNVAVNYNGVATQAISRNIAIGLQLATENPQKLH